MKYKEKYFEIINNGLKEKPEVGYYEKHHIVPRSICPLLIKAKQNLVYLTAKNHFLAHYYLWKWFRDELHDKKWTKKTCFAFNMMKRLITKSDDIEELSKLYEEVRIDFSEAMSETNKGRHHTEETRRNLSKANKGKKLSEETRKKLSESHKGEKNPRYGKHLSEESRRKMSETKKKPILQYAKDGIFIREWKSATDAERELGITKQHISQCCKGKCKSAGGFVWVYK